MPTYLTEITISNQNSCHLKSIKILYMLLLSTFIFLSIISLDAMKINNTFFISHGSPSLSIDDSIPARDFLKGWKKQDYGQIPKAILVISGHWQTDEPTVSSVDGILDTSHDFYGFPASMYKLKYPAPGAPNLAKRVQELLKGSGFERVHVEKRPSLDSGAWVPLMLMYPEADIPVCQLSIQLHLDGTHHYNVGLALAPLKDEGVMIIGSGSATHNLRDLRFNTKEIITWAREFDQWLEEALTAGRYQDVNDFENKAPHAKKAHPSPDHFYPLHVAAGAGGEKAKAELIHRSWELGTVSYASYKFTDTPI